MAINNVKHIKFVNICPLDYPIGINVPQLIKYIDNVLIKIKPKIKEKSINLWVRGSSGTILSGLFVKSVTNLCKIYYIRKPEENSHWMKHNIADNTFINIILDDFVATGSTVNAIYDEAIKLVSKIDFLVIANISDCRQPFKFTPKYIVCDNSLNLTNL